jgi:lambda family phage portal protein
MAFTFTPSGRAVWSESAPLKAKAGSQPFDSAASGRRGQNWIATKLGPNTVQWGNVDVIRDRARDAVRKNPYAANAVATYTAEAVGTGIRPQSQHPDPAIKTQIHQAWERWQADADWAGNLDFYGLQRLAWRSMMESGETFGRHRLRGAAKAKKRGLAVPYQVQLIEPDQCPTFLLNFPSIPVGNTVREGIEFDTDGDRVAYHMYKEHPGDAAFYPDAYMLSRLPADDMVHLFEPLRCGQFRGQPWMAQVLVKLYDLDAYDDAELVRKKTVAMFAGFVQKTTVNDTPFNETQVDPSDSTGQSAIVSLEPGTLQVLLPNEQVTFSTPPKDGNYVEFMRTQLRAVAAGIGLTYEQLTGDLTGVNYSSIRAGILQFRRKCEQYQYLIFAHQFCRPIWRRFIREAVFAGALDLPGYARDPWQYEQVQWITPGWPWVDPLKDSQASLMDIRAGLTSRRRVVAATGEDVEQIDREQLEDHERTTEMGLIYDSDPNQVLAARETIDTAPDAEDTPKKAAPVEEDEDDSEDDAS